MQRSPTSRGFALTLALLATALAAGCPTPEERAGEARSEAERALEAGRRADAVAALDRLRAAQPETPEARIELAKLLVQAGEAPQAVWLL
jgi:thioredoxin-like negative regulator of GroEL